MPLLVLIFLTAACMPEARTEAWVDWDAPTRVLATLGLAAFGMLAACALSLRTKFAAYGSPLRRSAAIRRYFGTRWALLFVNIGLSLAAIFLLGWGRIVEEFCRVPWRGESVLAPFAELLVAGPYLANVFANWFIYYYAERALHRTSLNPQVQRFWSLFGFVLFNARQFALLVMFPILLFAGQLTLIRFFPELLGEWWYQLGSILGVVMLFLVLPRVAKPMLGLLTLPAGKFRTQLEATEKRLKFHRTDLLLWPTRGGAANALIVGIVPQARYVIFTDSLLESLTPPELDAVFGHEVGHAHHGHLAYYAVFILLSGLAISGIVGVAHELAEHSGVYAAMPAEWRTPLKIAPLLVMGTYLFVVFGWLSRVCERQADIAGARAGSCGDPHCSGHDHENEHEESSHEEPVPLAIVDSEEVDLFSTEEFELTPIPSEELTLPPPPVPEPPPPEPLPQSASVELPLRTPMGTPRLRFGVTNLTDGETVDDAGALPFVAYFEAKVVPRRESGWGDALPPLSLSGREMSEVSGLAPLSLGGRGAGGAGELLRQHPLSPSPAEGEGNRTAQDRGSRIEDRTKALAPQSTILDPTAPLTPSPSPAEGEESKKHLCETGLRAMVMALEAVMGMNGLGGITPHRSFSKRWLAWFRSWQHGPPNARIEYLQSLMVNPELAMRHDRYAFRVRLGIALVLLAIIAATGSYIGWNEVWKMM